MRTTTQTISRDELIAQICDLSSLDADAVWYEVRRWDCPFRWMVTGETEDDEDDEEFPDTTALPDDLAPLLALLTEAQRATLLRLGVASALGSCLIATFGDDEIEEQRKLLTRIVAQVDALEREARE